MVAIDYEITQPISQKVIDDIVNQPNFITISTYNMGMSNPYTVFTFDHTPSQAISFKKYLATKIGLYDDALAKYVNKAGVQFMHSTDTPRTFTNIGTTFVNVYNRSDGMSFGIDSDVYDNVRVIIHWTKGGADTGTHTVQIIEKGSAANILVSMDVVSGVNISPTTAIPAILKDTTKIYVIQAKSTVASDDPTFEGLRLYMK